MIISLLEFRTSFAGKIEQRLDALVPHTDRLTEAMRYSLLGPGKKLRPLLVFASADLFRVPEESVLDPACALEMVHAYSLIHDDLPCMDDDDLRRGRPTAHRAFGEATALLAGDALLTQAFETLAEAPLSDCVRVRLIRCLAARAGKKGMISGQVKDLFGCSQEEIPFMFQQKTGDLFSCALEFGALLGKADPAPMRTLGLLLGLAYQLKDDLEDDDGLFSREKTKNFFEKTIQEIKEILASLPATFLKKLVREILSF